MYNQAANINWQIFEFFEIVLYGKLILSKEFRIHTKIKWMKDQIEVNPLEKNLQLFYGYSMIG